MHIVLPLLVNVFLWAWHFNEHTICSNSLRRSGERNSVSLNTMMELPEISKTMHAMARSLAKNLGSSVSKADSVAH